MYVLLYKSQAFFSQLHEHEILNEFDSRYPMSLVKQNSLFP